MAASEAFPGTATDIFLLKLDIEGLEPTVLRSIVRDGAPHVKFVTFEYASNVWQEPVSAVLQDLFVGGYFCFLITADRLFSVSGPFWDVVYELPMWSNFICGQESDPDLQALVQLHTGAVGIWPMLPNMYLAGYPAASADSEPPRNLLEAQQMCTDLGAQCGGVTCECRSGDCGSSVLPPSARGSAAPKLGPCTLRAGVGGLRRSPSGEVTFLRDPVVGEPFTAYRRAAEMSSVQEVV